MSTTASATASESTIEIINGFPVPDFSDEPNAPQQNKKACPPAPRKPKPTSLQNLKSKRSRALSFD